MRQNKKRMGNPASNTSGLFTLGRFILLIEAAPQYNRPKMNLKCRGPRCHIL